MRELPRGWAQSQISEWLDISTGKLDANAANENGRFPFFTCAEQVSKIDTFAFDCQAVLLAGNGNFNLHKFVGKFNAYQRTYVLQPREVDLGFAFLAMKQLLPEITKDNRGSTIKYLRLGDIANTVSPLPPLPEQRRIVRKLDTLTARTTTARTHLTAIEILVERYKLAVLDAALFSNMAADVPLISFIDVLSDTQNGLSKRGGDEGKPQKVLRLADLTGNRFDGQDPRSILLNENEAQKYRLSRGDLVIIRVNGSDRIVGRLIVWGDDTGWAYCDHFIRARTQPNVHPEYLHHYFETDRVRAQIEATFVSSAGQKTVSKKTLARIKVPIPSLDEQREIVRQIETAFAKIDRRAAEAKKALKLTDRLDQRILAKAFAGELVPQDPNDEPASVLLARIRTERAAAPKPKRGRKKASQ